MEKTSQNGPEDSARTESSKDPRSTLRREIYALSAKIIVLIVGTWTALHLFALFVAPHFGFTQFHVKIAGIIATLIISFLVITAIRKLLKRLTSKIHPQFSASLSFFAIIIISLFAGLSILDELNVNAQAVLFSGGVAAIIIGIGVSTIVGNILSSGLLLTTYPARIGDSIHVVNDNIHGKIHEINMMYTTVETDEGKEYIVPNSAIIQGNVRILKDAPLSEPLPYSEGDKVEIMNQSEKYEGTVIKITPKFTTVLNYERTREFVVANRSVLGGDFRVIKHRAEP